MNYTPELTRDVLKRMYRAFGFANSAFSATKPRQWHTRVIETHFGKNDLGRFIRGHLITCTNVGYSSDHGVCKEYILNVNGSQYIQHLLMNKTYVSYSDYEIMRETVSVSMPENVLEDAVDMSETEVAEVADVLTAYVDSSTSRSDICSYILMINKKLKYPSVLHRDVSYKQLAIMRTTLDLYQDELQTLQFTYIDKSHRLWHNLQKVNGDYKKQVLATAGLIHEYDVECSAQTLLTQFSRRGQNMLQMKEYPVLTNYINNRTAIRNQLAQEIGIPVKTIKEIITALVCGAKLRANEYSDIYRLLKKNREILDKIKNNQFIKDFIKDVEEMWSMIAAIILPNELTKKGTQRKRAMTSKVKWNLYFQLERQVLDAAKEYLDKTDNKYFLEHDGWSTLNAIDLNDLTAYISTCTGFSVKLDYEQFKA